VTNRCALFTHFQGQIIVSIWYKNKNPQNLWNDPFTLRFFFIFK
jgi:hypothetical protein